MSEELNNINLRNLTLNELVELRNKCDYLIKQKSKVDTPNVATENSILFYDKLRLVSRNEGVTYFPTLEILERTNSDLYNKYIDQYNEFEKWIMSIDISLKSIDFIERLVVKNLLIKLKTNPKIDNVNYQLVLANVKNLPQVFEQMFPEYIKCDFVGKLECILTKGNKNDKNT